MTKPWPTLSYIKGKDTFTTLKLFTQIIGKIKLATLPWINHSWHVSLQIIPTGLTTLTIPTATKDFQIDFDFIEHQLQIKTSQGEFLYFSLRDISVAEFFRKVFDCLRRLKIEVNIFPVPSEIENPIPFKEDYINHTYDKIQVENYHQALLNIQAVFMKFRSIFKGKSSPIQFYWGSFDLALSFFSGREAPQHPGGIPGLPDWVAIESYNREVSSSGFWIGDENVREPAFYAYIYPEPSAYHRANILPEAAYYHSKLGEFILPYSIVQESEDEEKTVLNFLMSTYQAGADLAEWNRGILE